MMTIHELGWVHRDISAGNVFIYKQGTTSARVILADLEYAKKMGSDGAALSDVRTVSPLIAGCLSA